MIDARDRLPDADHRRFGRRSPYHDHGNAKRARGGDLAIGRAAAAVARNDKIDAVIYKKALLIRFGKRPACEDIAGFRQGRGRIDGIDAADNVEMLRLGGKMGELLASDRQQNRARLFAETRDGFLDAGRVDPTVAGDGLPGSPLKSDQRQAGLPRGEHCIARDAHGERVGCIDENIDMRFPQKPGKAFRPSESAHADFTGMRQRCLRATREGERDPEVLSRREARGKKACLGRPAQNEDMPNDHHVF